MHRRRYSSALRAACFAVLAAVALAPSAAGLQALPFTLPTPEQSVTVEVRQPSPAVGPSGRLRADVVVSLAAPAEYFEVRLRLYSPTGHLIYQKTEIEPDVPQGSQTVSYDYDLAPLELTHGRYPLEIRVLATGSDPTTVSSRLLVVDPALGRLPVAVVISATGIPATAFDGTYTTDPADDTRLRDDLTALAALASRGRTPLALAVPPLLIEQLARVSAGYETTAGITVAAESEVPRSYAAAIENLRSAVTTGAIELLDVPYALPDLTGIASTEAAGDLGEHWDVTDIVFPTLLHTDTAAHTAFIGALPDPSLLSSLRDRGTSALLVTPDAVQGAFAERPGVRVADGLPFVLAVADGEVASAVLSETDDFYDALFDRVGSGPVIIMITLGPGGVHTVDDLARAFERLERVQWAQPVPLAEALRAEPRPATLSLPARTKAPQAYWQDVATARQTALAYAAAAGQDDELASAALRAVLVAESSLWGVSGREWDPAGAGRALADTARSTIEREFELITLDVKDVTLSGRDGHVPLTLINGTGKTLALAVHAVALEEDIESPVVAVDVQPTENFLTIPIDLGTSTGDDFRISVTAGDRVVAEATVAVRASYLDRLAIVGMVVIVLIVLLLFIRRRVNAAIAGTIPDSARTGPAGDDDPSEE